MKNYYTATICKNGHVISAYDGDSQPYCEICGAETVSHCSKCNKQIRGKLNDDYSYGYPYSRPYYCPYCGHPYPWTETMITSATELLSFTDQINKEEKEVLKNSISGLIVETPSTSISIFRWQNYLSKIKKPLHDAFYQLFVDVISESTRKILFPNRVD